MSNKHFAKVPTISIPRSKWNQPHTLSTTFQHGKLVPIDCFETIAGDTISLDLASYIRLNTPIAPLFSNIKMYIHAYSIPFRILWDKWEEFFGANKDSAGPQTRTYTIPNDVCSDIVDDTVSAYLGKPVNIPYAANKTPKMSLMKERAYWLIWSEWYRAEQLQAPLKLSNGDNVHGVGTIGSTSINRTSKLATVCKEFDYFTSGTLAPQYGASVTIPLGSFAPVSVSSGSVTPDIITGTDGNIKAVDGESYVPQGAELEFKANLAEATAATINSIRYAFQVQKYLERANFGSRYFEILKVHYGITSPDSRMQRPEYLGGTEFYININQVLSTAGYSADSTTEVGQPGAVSITLNKTHLFSKGIVEPGLIMVLLETKHERIYSGQGLLREDTKFNRFDYYSPEFANLGDQAILNKEIKVTSDGTDEDVFAYNEHWAEYRYRQNSVSGKMIPGVTNSIPFWTLAENFGNRPQLNEDFILEDRKELARALTTGIGSPFDYIANFAFNYRMTREMPLYSVPGLIDHFGVM